MAIAIHLSSAASLLSTEFRKKIGELLVAKTKSEVIAEAATFLTARHPNKDDPLKRRETLKASFSWLCRDIGEDQPEASAAMIISHVKGILAQKRLIK